MRIVFLRIAWQEFYRGVANDIPRGGGSYVAVNNDGHEKYNFDKVRLSKEKHGYPDGEYCLGFFETMQHNGCANEFHVEKILGCNGDARSDCAKGVLVVFCATHPENHNLYVVGWYKSARVFRKYKNIRVSETERIYITIAKAENSILLPIKERMNGDKWLIPKSNEEHRIGFGHRNVWYAKNNDNDTQIFLEKIINNIEAYSLQIKRENKSSTRYDKCYEIINEREYNTTTYIPQFILDKFSSNTFKNIKISKGRYAVIKFDKSDRGKTLFRMILENEAMLKPFIKLNVQPHCKKGTNDLEMTWDNMIARDFYFNYQDLSNYTQYGVDKIEDILKNIMKDIVYALEHDTKYEPTDYFFMPKVKIKPRLIENAVSKSYERDNDLIDGVKKNRNFRCEIDPSHKTFDHGGNQYVEIHHLIPFHHQDKFEYSIDIEENLICLCPICHKRLHYQSEKLRRKELSEIYKTRDLHNKFKSRGIEISEDKFIKLAMS